MSLVAARVPPEPSNPPKVDTDDEYDEDEASGDEDDAGSLVDFIEEDKSGDEEDDASSTSSEPPQTKEEAIRRDLDGISALGALEELYLSFNDVADCGALARAAASRRF